MAPKRAKKEAESEEHSGSEEEAPKKVKKAKKPVVAKKAIRESTEGGLERNSDNEPVLALSNTRRVAIRSFKGKTLIDVREMYEKDGKTMPGSKGISLTVEQWKILTENISLIDEAIGELGDE